MKIRKNFASFKYLHLSSHGLWPLQVFTYHSVLVGVTLEKRVDFFLISLKLVKLGLLEPLTLSWWHGDFR